ncbi:MAG: hypothetical protein ACR2MX_04290 [Cyclobacteriaceae bacterium]
MRKLYCILCVVILTVPATAQEMVNETASWFDFWVGNWEVSWQNPDSTIGKGTNHVIKVLDGKVIQENFEITDAGPNTGFKGTSLSVFNPNTETWHQAWADNQGGYYNFVGGAEGDRRIFKTLPLERNGKTIVLRMVFYDISDQTLNWDWERSEDGGSTWQLQWRIHYKKKS